MQHNVLAEFVMLKHGPNTAYGGKGR